MLGQRNLTKKRAGEATELARRLAGDTRFRKQLISADDDRSLRLCALRAGIYDEVRAKVKPSIPEIGDNGIPLRDELELELKL